METFYEVDADEVEIGDQIIIDGEPVEVVSLPPAQSIDEIIIRGYSHSTGDRETYTVKYNQRFEVWGI
jgi:hypothetical protein